MNTSCPSLSQPRIRFVAGCSDSTKTKHHSVGRRTTTTKSKKLGYPSPDQRQRLSSELSSMILVDNPAKKPACLWARGASSVESLLARRRTRSCDVLNTVSFNNASPSRRSSRGSIGVAREALIDWSFEKTSASTYAASAMQSRYTYIPTRGKRIRAHARGGEVRKNHPLLLWER